MIGIILTLALILRLINLNQSLWWDEAINVVYAKSSSFWHFVTAYPIGDFHPPGYFAILWLWGNTFGFSEISVRLPSVIFAVLTVFLTFLIGKELFSKKTGLLAALFLCFAPLHIYYSQEARMYSLAAFTVTLSSYFFLRLVSGLKYGFWGYSFSIFLLLYSDYLPYLVLPAHIFFVIIYYRKLLKKYTASLIIGGSTVIPWFLIFPDQFKKGIETSAIVSGWREVVGGAGYKEAILLPLKILTGRITFENKLLYILLIIIVSIPYVFAFKKLINHFSRGVNFLLLWTLIPIVSAFTLSFFIPIFNYFRFLFILPAIYLLTAAGLNKYKSYLRLSAVVLIVVFEILASGLYLINPKFHREDWKSAVKFIEQNSDSRTLTLHKNSEIPASFTYYQSESINSLVAFNKIPAHSDKDLIDLDKNLVSFERIFVFNYLVDITDPNRLLEAELEKLKFEKIKDYDFRGVGLISLYQRSH